MLTANVSKIKKDALPDITILDAIPPVNFLKND